ncbi:hypothetical protein V8E54_009279 [Elaphomyces granulatus]
MIRRGALKGELIGYPAIDFSPDGRLVAFISGGGVKLQGQDSDGIVGDFRQTCAESPDKRFSTLIFTDRAGLWDSQTGLRDDRFPHEARTYAFSPDGHSVALLSTGRG